MTDSGPFLSEGEVWWGDSLYGVDRARKIEGWEPPKGCDASCAYGVPGKKRPLIVLGIISDELVLVAKITSARKKNADGSEGKLKKDCLSDWKFRQRYIEKGIRITEKKESLIERNPVKITKEMLIERNCYKPKLDKSEIKILQNEIRSKSLFGRLNPRPRDGPT